MKKNRVQLVLISCLLLAGVIVFLREPALPETPGGTFDVRGVHTEGRPNIVIFSSKGGGGHTSVSNALREYLGKDYNIRVVNIFTEVLGPIMPLYQIIGDRLQGEEIYNYAIQKRWHRFITLMLRAGTTYFDLQYRSIVALVERYLERLRPDLVISVIPLVNGMIAEASREQNLPLLVIPTDLDATTFMHGIRKAGYDKCHVAMSFEDDLIRERVELSELPAERIHTVGFPVRPAFLLPSKKRHARGLRARRELSIPQRVPVILVLMGAVGSRAIVPFAEKLSQLDQHVHIIFAIGKSEHLRERLDSLEMPEHIATTVMGFTDRMADLMAAADLLISKSGTASVCEALYAELPLLLDATAGVPIWERFNHGFIKEHGFGETISSLQVVVPMVEKFLTGGLQTAKKNLIAFEKKNPRSEIRTLVAELVKM